MSKSQEQLSFKSPIDSQDKIKMNDTAVINYSELRQTIADFHISAKKDCLSVESVQILSDFFITMSNEVTEEERSLHNTQIRCLQREKTPVISAHC